MSLATRAAAWVRMRGSHRMPRFDADMPTGSTSEGLRDLAERCRLWSERAAKPTDPSMRPTVWEELAATAAEITARTAVLPPAFALHLVGVTFCHINGFEAYLPHSPARPRVSHDVAHAVDALVQSLHSFGDDTAKARAALAAWSEGRDARVHALRQLAHDLLDRADRLDGATPSRKADEAARDFTRRTRTQNGQPVPVWTQAATMAADAKAALELRDRLKRSGSGTRGRALPGR